MHVRTDLVDGWMDVGVYGTASITGLYMLGMKFGGVAFPKLKFQEYVLRIFPVIFVEN